MYPDRAGAQLRAVADQVVEISLYRSRVFFHIRDVALLGHCEHVVSRIPFLLLLVPFEERKIDDPAEAELTLIVQVQFLSQLGPHRPERQAGLLPLRPD
ncbi:hypothetical protein ES708_30904 [subsurface metagenome]